MLKQASHAAAVLGNPRPNLEEMESILDTTTPLNDLPESLRRSARRLLREENSSLLQDLVSGGACSFGQLLHRVEEIGQDEIDLVEWLRPLAEMEERERAAALALRPKD